MVNSTQVEELMVQLQPKIEKVRIAFRALDNFMIKVETLLGAKDHLFLVLTDIYGSFGYLQRWTSEYLSMADEITSPFYSTIESIRVSLHSDKRNFENIFIAFQGRVDKDAIMRAEAKMAVAKWQINAEKNGDGKNKKFEKTKLLASQMTATSELSRIHHEALIEDLMAFGEQCESYFTPSLSSLISFTGNFIQCKEKFSRKFSALSSLLANPYLHPIDPANLGPRSQSSPSILPHESPFPEDSPREAKARSNSDGSQGTPSSPAKSIFKRGSTDISTPSSSPPSTPNTPPRSPRARAPAQSHLGTIITAELSPLSARRLSKPIPQTSSSTDTSPSDSPILTDSASSSPIQHRHRSLSRPNSISYTSIASPRSSSSYAPKPPLSPSLSSPMLVDLPSKPPTIVIPTEECVVPAERSPPSIIIPRSPLSNSLTIPDPFATPSSVNDPPISPSLSIANPLPLPPTDSPYDSPILAVGSPLLPTSSTLIPSPALSISSSITNSPRSPFPTSPRSPFPTSPSLDSFTDVTSKSMDMAMLLVELAAGEAGDYGIGPIPSAGIGAPIATNGGNTSNNSIGNAGDKAPSITLTGGGRGGSVGRYTPPSGGAARHHGRFSVDVSRLAQLAINGGQTFFTSLTNITSPTITTTPATTTPNTTPIPITINTPPNTNGNSGYTSSPEEGHVSQGLNTSSDNLRMPAPNYSAKTADEVIKSFDDLLANPLAVQYFHEFVKTRVCEENVLFWMEVQDFKNFGFYCDRKTNSADLAKRIYATFLRQRAEKEVNIPESLREIIAERLNEPTVTMFDEAQAEVLSLMRSDLFSSFAGTEIAKRLTARLNKKDFSLFIPSYASMGLHRKDSKEKDPKVSKSNSILL